MSLKRHYLSLVLVMLVAGLCAQSNTMYYLSGVPQGYYLNPASQPQPNIFIGFPVFSSFYVDFYHNSIGPSDIVWNDPETGEVLHPFHPDGGMESFIDKFEDVNDLSANLDFSLASFGFRVRKLYFTFDITSRLNQGISFSKDLVEFGINGNEDGETYNFSSMGFNFTEHMEVAVGVSRVFGDMITVGVRPKLLLGIASISSRNNDVTLFTSHDEWNFESDLNLQVATPGFTVPTDENGTFDPTGSFEFDSTLTSSDYLSLATGNKGFGIDLGIHVRPMKELSLSASVIDLGVIKWNDYIHEAQLGGTFKFTGAEFTTGDVNNESDTASFATTLLDSLRGSFEVTGSSEPYTTMLTPKIFVGASYSILPRLDIGLLARFDLPETGFEYDLMLHANWRPSTVFGLSACYSPFAGRSSTFGLGTSFRFGPFSFYGVADYNTLRFTLYKYQTETNNIPVFITSDDRSRFNFRFGINFVLGWNQRKKLMKDKPMYYSGDY